MRIAISGSHRVGKTSLAEALASILPGYELASEPYHALEEEGHEFSDMPSLDDFLLQLERSLASLEQSGPNTIFDRCPLDIVAYLQTHEERDAFHLSDSADRIRGAMARLSLLVFVPIEWLLDRRGLGHLKDIAVPLAGALLIVLFSLVMFGLSGKLGLAFERIAGGGLAQLAPFLLWSVLGVFWGALWRFTAWVGTRLRRRFERGEA